MRPATAAPTPAPSALDRRSRAPPPPSHPLADGAAAASDGGGDVDELVNAEGTVYYHNTTTGKAGWARADVEEPSRLAARAEDVHERRESEHLRRNSGQYRSPGA